MTKKNSNGQPTIIQRPTFNVEAAQDYLGEAIVFRNKAWETPEAGLIKDFLPTEIHILTYNPDKVGRGRKNETHVITAQQLADKDYFVQFIDSSEFELK